MNIQHKKVLAGCALILAALAGCSGNSNDQAVVTPPPDTPVTPPVTPVGTTVTVAGIVKYFTDLFAGNSETTEPMDITNTTLTVDEVSEPTAQ